MKTTKHYIVHPSTIRSLLKREGFNVGSSSTSSKIRGMGTFHGGNIEITEEHQNYNTTYSKTPTGIKSHTSYDVLCRLSVFTNNLYQDVDQTKLISVLLTNGYTVSKSGNDLIISK